MWTCTGAADSTNDMTQRIETPTAGGALEITNDGTFGLDVSSGEGLAVTGGSSGTSVTIDIDGDITAEDPAILVNQEGNGMVSVTTRGAIRSDGPVGFGAIEINQSGIGAVSVKTHGNINKQGSHGVFVKTVAETTGDVSLEMYDGDVFSAENGIFVKSLGSGEITVTTNANFDTGSSGIYVDQDGTNSVTVTSTGDTLDVGGSGIRVVTVAETMGSVLIETNSNIMTASSGTAEGIFVNQRGVGAVTITTDGTVNSGGEAGIRVMTADGVTTGDVGITVNNDVTGGIGIDVNNQGSGDVTINVNAEVASSSSSGTAIDLNGKGTQTIILGTGASIMGAIDAEEDVVANIEVAGNVSDFNFGNLGSGVDSFTVNEGSVLAIEGAQSWSGAVTLSGRLEITGNHPIREGGSTFSVASLAGNGVIDIDVDFSNGDMTFSESRISAQSATGSITVNVRSMGEFPEISEDDEDGLITIGNFIQVTNTASPNTFVAGRSLSRGFRFELVHDDTNANVWSIVARAGGVEEALYESLPATLTQLASLQSYQQRLQGRQHGNNGRVWAKVSGASTEFEPASTSLATHEIGNVATEFGIDVPLLTDYPYIPYNLTVGASASFGEATTDVTAGESTGEIATRNFKAAILANWQYEDVYVDGQLQYAILGNEIKADTKLADEEATAYSAGLEVGYGIDIRGFRVTPSAQLAWTSVDFDHFTDLAGTEVVSDDSSIFTGRAGVGVEGSIPFANILLRGNADVLMPLDGKVNTKVDGTELVSEREDPVFDVGVGATYAWDETYMLTADISTQQGSEVKGYDANIGIKYKF